MKILITGATGFIGKNFLNSISEDVSILAISKSHNQFENTNNKVEYIISDLGDVEKYKKFVYQFEPTVAIHLAWHGIPDLGQKNSQFNKRISIKLIDVLVKLKSIKKIIITGSCLEYSSSKINCKEDQSILPNSYFSTSKNDIRKYLKKECDENQIDYYWLRLFYVYGKYQRKDSLIPSLINCLLKKEVPIINNPYDENDYINIDDVVDFIKLILKSKMESGIYNIGSGKTLNPIQISRIIEKKLYRNDDLTKKILLKKNEGKQIKFYANIMKFSKYYDTHNLISLDQGIEKLINEFKNDNL